MATVHTIGARPPITFGTHYLNRPSSCLLCSGPTSTGIFVCSSCNSRQLENISDVDPELRVKMEKEDEEYCRQFEQPKPAYQPASGYYNTSGLIAFLNSACASASLRWAWKMACLSGMEASNDGHHDIWNYTQAQRFLALRQRGGKTSIITFNRREDGSELVAISCS